MNSKLSKKIRKNIKTQVEKFAAVGFLKALKGSTKDRAKLAWRILLGAPIHKLFKDFPLTDQSVINYIKNTYSPESIYNYKDLKKCSNRSKKF